MPEIHAPAPNHAEFGLDTQWRTASGYTLRFTKNGNLELRNKLGSKLWESGTADRGAHVLTMQIDGNLVIYDKTLTKAVWATNTHDHEGAFLALQEDGNIVIYSPSGDLLWTTDTAGK